VGAAAVAGIALVGLGDPAAFEDSPVVPSAVLNLKNKTKFMTEIEDYGYSKGEKVKLKRGRGKRDLGESNFGAKRNENG
jgi:hypothetical protein